MSWFLSRAPADSEPAMGRALDLVEQGLGTLSAGHPTARPPSGHRHLSEEVRARPEAPETAPRRPHWRRPLCSAVAYSGTTFVVATAVKGLFSSDSRSTRDPGQQRKVKGREVQMLEFRRRPRPWEVPVHRPDEPLALAVLQ